MPRKRLPEDEKKVQISIRLPKKIIDKLLREGKINQEIERILLEYFSKQ